MINPLIFQYDKKRFSYGLIKKEVRMKKNVWVCFFMVFILVLVPVGLFSQEEDEEEEPVK